MTTANQQVRRTFTVGDRLTAVAMTLTNAAGTAIDLTGQTVAFRMVDAVTGVVKVNNAAATIDTAAEGKVSYAFAAVDCDTAGKYYAWFIRTRTADSLVEHHPGDGAKFILEFVAAQ